MLNSSRLIRAVILVFPLLGLSTPSALANFYGAIAYSRYSGAVGYSYNYRTRASAERQALAECGSNCGVALWFRNSCGSLASSSDGAVGVGASYYQRNAQNESLLGCYEGGGRSCRIVASACTDR
jgi:serine/threonine-protein kinase